jgi:hypothetical protein
MPGKPEVPEMTSERAQLVLLAIGLVVQHDSPLGTWERVVRRALDYGSSERFGEVTAAEINAVRQMTVEDLVLLAAR